MIDMEKMNVIKQIIVVRTDLDMGKGKMVVQGSHGSVNAAIMSKEGDIWAKKDCFKNPQYLNPKK